MNEWMNEWRMKNFINVSVGSSADALIGDTNCNLIAIYMAYSFWIGTWMNSTNE